MFIFFFSTSFPIQVRVDKKKKDPVLFICSPGARAADRLSRVTQSRKSFSVPPDFFPRPRFFPYFFFFLLLLLFARRHTGCQSQNHLVNSVCVCVCMYAAYTYEIRPVFFFFPPAFSRALISYASRSATPAHLPEYLSPHRSHRRRNLPDQSPAVTCNALETFQNLVEGGETHRSGKCFGFENAPHAHDTYDVPDFPGEQWGRLCGGTRSRMSRSKRLSEKTIGERGKKYKKKKKRINVFRSVANEHVRRTTIGGFRCNGASLLYVGQMSMARAKTREFIEIFIIQIRISL